MKLIIAMVRTDRLRDIQEALRRPDTFLMYVSQVGDVREPLSSTYRGTEYQEPRPRLRLDVVVVNDLMAPDAIETIMGIACDPTPDGVSSGNIFVMPLDAWIHIPSGQHTREAV
jgi:nitrogen regulatory protein PII